MTSSAMFSIDFVNSLLKNSFFCHKNIRKQLIKEKGCTEPLYGQKAKCVIKIVPQKEKCKTLTIDKKCIKSKIDENKK